MGQYDWDAERATFARNAGGLNEERALSLLDQAAASAKAGDLRGAARFLEEIRSAVVAGRLFQGWDNGIWCFTSLIKFIRQMSPETAVPLEYQRFLDAIPSAKWDEDLTPKQKLFWYGSAKAEVGGSIRLVDTEPKADKPGRGCAILLGLVVLAAVAYFALK